MEVMYNTLRSSSISLNGLQALENEFSFDIILMGRVVNYSDSLIRYCRLLGAAGEDSRVGYSSIKMLFTLEHTVSLLDR